MIKQSLMCFQPVHLDAYIRMLQRKLVELMLQLLSMSALDTALDVFAGVDMAVVKRKSDGLFDLFVSEIETRAPELEILTPRNAGRRGSQISLRHPEAYAVVQALIGRGVVGDFRQPDIIRLGLTPLYLRYQDVHRAAEILGDIIATRAWDKPELKRRAKVV